MKTFTKTLFIFSFFCLFIGSKAKAQSISLCSDLTCDITVTATFEPGCRAALCPGAPATQTWVLPAGFCGSSVPVLCGCPIIKWDFNDGTNFYSVDTKTPGLYGITLCDKTINFVASGPDFFHVHLH